MWKTLFVVLATLTLISSAVSAEAGTVVLISDTWDNICKVEIKWGANAPNNDSSATFEHVEKGWKVSKPDRICYRRSGQPSNCSSEMTAWTCCTHNISGSYQCSLS